MTEAGRSDTAHALCGMYIQYYTHKYDNLYSQASIRISIYSVHCSRRLPSISVRTALPHARAKFLWRRAWRRRGRWTTVCVMILVWQRLIGVACQVVNNVGKVDRVI